MVGFKFVQIGFRQPILIRVVHEPNTKITGLGTIWNGLPAVWENRRIGWKNCCIGAFQKARATIFSDILPEECRIAP